MDKRFVAYFYCNGPMLSLGVSIDFRHPNVEIHVPGGFFRIGWEPASWSAGHATNGFLFRSFGLK